MKEFDDDHNDTWTPKNKAEWELFLQIVENDLSEKQVNDINNYAIVQRREDFDLKINLENLSNARKPGKEFFQDTSGMEPMYEQRRKLKNKRG